MRIIPPESLRTVPWKNGLGSTLEILTDIDTSQTPSAAWTWRLSIADVPSRSPFSNFDGIDRWLACLHGGGMCVERSGSWSAVPKTGEALAFAGEEQIVGEPIGQKVRDVNWFLQRDRWHGGMWVLRESSDTQIESEIVVIHVVAGTASATIRCEGQSVTLAPGFTVQTGGSTTIESDPSSVVVIAWASVR